MKNLKELKTTVLGSVLMIIGIMYFAFPYFSEKDLWEVDNMYLAIMFLGGIGLLLAPDRILNFAFKKAGEKKD